MRTKVFVGFAAVFAVCLGWGVANTQLGDAYACAFDEHYFSVLHEGIRGSGGQTHGCFVREDFTDCVGPGVVDNYEWTGQLADLDDDGKLAKDEVSIGSFQIAYVQIMQPQENGVFERGAYCFEGTCDPLSSAVSSKVIFNGAIWQILMWNTQRCGGGIGVFRP